MATNQTLSELLELIDEHKTSLPDYAYMKMMECVKTIHEKHDKKDYDAQLQLQFNQLSERNTALTSKLYRQLNSTRRCSNCRGTDHTKNGCWVIKSIRIDSDTFDVPLWLNVIKSDWCEGLLRDALTGMIVGKVIKSDDNYEPVGTERIFPYDDPTKKLVIDFRDLNRRCVLDDSTMDGMRGEYE
jgi:hypothetical protein